MSALTKRRLLGMGATTPLVILSETPQVRADPFMYSDAAHRIAQDFLIARQKYDANELEVLQALGIVLGTVVLDRDPTLDFQVVEAMARFIGPQVLEGVR